MSCGLLNTVQRVQYIRKISTRQFFSPSDGVEMSQFRPKNTFANEAAVLAREARLDPIFDYFDEECVGEHLLLVGRKASICLKVVKNWVYRTAFFRC